MATKTRTELWGSANFGGGNRRWRRSRMLEKPQVSGRGAVSCWHRIPAFSLSRGWGKKQEEGEKRKQEKGTVSRQVPRRSEERSVGKECVSTGRTRWSP